jgi:hypothetical protein
VLDRTYYLKPSTSSFRVKRFQLFLERLQVKSTDRILDVGGRAETWEGTGLEGSVTLLNVEHSENRREPFRRITADACEMSALPDRSFDVVFSNSVIEHVGDFDRQQKMAREVQRVSAKYWVQTPYKHFPLEPHFLFPFYQYLPRSSRIAVGKIWPFSHAKVLGLDPVREADNIWLLNRRQFTSLFNDAVILDERFGGMTKSLVAARY